MDRLQRLLVSLPVLALAGCGLGGEGGHAPAATVERVSVASDGSEGDGPSATGAGTIWTIRLNQDGQVVVFTSQATNLGADDPNGDGEDAFLHDRRTAETIRVSRLSYDSGTPVASAGHPTVSADGRRVGMVSYTQVAVYDRATDSVRVVARDEVFYSPELSADGEHLAVEGRSAAAQVLDFEVGHDELVSHDPDGNLVAARSPVPDGSGRRIVFGSRTPLVEGAEGVQVYLFDRDTGETTLLSAGPDGETAPDAGEYATWDVTPDGRYVVLDPAFEPGRHRIQRVDVETGETLFVSEGTGPRISDDGRRILFRHPGLPDVTPIGVSGDELHLWEQATGAVRYVAITHDGSTPENSVGAAIDISGDGRFAAFGSRAGNLVPDDTNEEPDVFVVALD